LRYFQDHWTYLTRPGAYPGIDALRFVAISTVALYHFQFLPWGWVGVDVFFVLSGFLIGGALLDEGRERRLSFGRFYGHRALRILPLYYLFVLLSFLFKAHSRVDETTIPSVLASLTFMQTTGAYYFKWPVDPAYIPGGSWSLVVEETFYLIAPLFIWILTRITRNMWICAAVSGGVFLSGIATRLAVTAGFAPDDPNWHFASFIQFHSRYDELAVGVAAAALVRATGGQHSRWVFGVLATACAIVFLTCFLNRPDLLLRPNAMTRITMWLPTLLGLGTAAAVLAVYDHPVTAPWIIVGARLSYGLYLLHIFVLEVSSPYGGTGWLLALMTATSFQTRAVIVLMGCVVLSYLLSLLVEYPFIRMYHRSASAGHRQRYRRVGPSIAPPS
jgi:peptidoglycan/LPS O-acetylase OafA/YrhL